ncbi:FGGY-family carbohydrate kinase [Paracoccus tegillarcae]|uniref:Carbohydrate kinase n=1 Tax=Paracoccus tegillarcae TaxID=1529068 RepID=A0A2K9EDG2_9RHOB|nr:FGGY-family carbohydrate kinase [Paracoccus tegillarcae]AUH32983.1 carbohydrate kinase [Paracoccus tegillarcae]
MLFGAVDVGSARARAAIFGSDGRLLARSSHGFSTIHGPDGQASYAFAEIWDAVASAMTEARGMAGAARDDLVGLSFDATCSLYVDAPGFAPDVIAWHDHRATAEAAELSAIDHPLARLAGGQVSPEMQTPKLMWLARHRPDAWAGLRAARDLSDQLAFVATGKPARSLCAMAAKWPYIAEAGGWQTDLLRQLGIGAMPREGAVLAPGTVIGPLTAQAADQLGLSPDCRVAAGLIDAFAGALGATDDMPVLIAGTSNCVMARDVPPRPAVWGPYLGAIVPGQVVSEAGQSATGALLDRIRQQYPQPQSHGDILSRLRPDQHEIGAGIHVLPDIKGNRTPFADPLMRGVIHGASLDRSPAALDALYWRAAIGIAMGTRQVIEHMGLGDTRRLAMAGGQARAPLLRQLYADVTGAEIHWQPEDAVLRGSAIVAAAPFLDGVEAARRRFALPAQIVPPNPATRDRLARDWRIFQRMQQNRAEIDALSRDGGE